MRLTEQNQSFQRRELMNFISFSIASLALMLETLNNIISPINRQIAASYKKIYHPPRTDRLIEQWLR